MKCSKCHSENPEGAKFCGECGEKFERLCPICRSPNALESKFCVECGHDLRLSFSPKKLEGATTTGERKRVTVLFSDLAGFTALTEKLDPEEVKEILAQLFGEIAKVVIKYEGFVDKYIGDAIMALFGVPFAHEDDAARAILAAREIHELVSSISLKHQSLIGRQLAMHTGISTGLVVTGEVKLEQGIHGILGDTVNVASRLVDFAKPGEILVNEETRHQAEGYFNFDTLEPINLEGKIQLTRPHKVLSLKEEPHRIRRLSGLRSELIGRTAEIGRLKTALENLRQGQGSIIAICGEPGIGKSRLVEEFKTRLELREIIWREGHCYAYAQNIPYFPLIDLLSRTWDIEEGAPPEKIRQIIEARIADLMGDKANLASYIGSLYSLSYPELEEKGADYWKVKLHESVMSILSVLCRRAATVILIEDLHWADPSSIELLRFILAGFDSPALFILLYRAPLRSFRTDQLVSLCGQYEEIRLRELSPLEMKKMVESLLKTDSIPSDLLHLIQSKGEGNPFYIEEIMNSLIDGEILVPTDGGWELTKAIDELDVPTTIQGIITARIDRLGKETKRVLQEASVIGRVFPYEILKKVTQNKDQLDICLNALERGDLIRRGSSQPNLEYVFKHALMQDVAYNGLLKKERNALHEKIGIVMEEVFDDRLAEYYETLALHFKEGKSHLKAVGYLVKSAEKSVGRYATDESFSYYEEAFEILSKKKERTETEDILLVNILLKWCHVYHCLGDYNGLTQLLEHHLSFVQNLDDRESLGMFYCWLGWALNRREKLQEAQAYLRKALEIGEQIHSSRVIGYSSAFLSFNCADLGLLDEAAVLGQRALKMVHLHQDVDMLRIAYSSMGYALWLRGEAKECIQLAQVILEHGKERFELRLQAHGFLFLGVGNLLSGDFPKAIEFCQRAVQVCPDPVFSLHARVTLMACYAAAARFEDCQITLEELIKFGKEYGVDTYGTVLMGVYGIVLLSQGNLEKGINLIEDAIQTCIKNGSKYRTALLYHLLGRVYLQIARGGHRKSFSFFMKNIIFLINVVPFSSKRAERFLSLAMEIARDIGALNILGQASLDLSHLYKIKGRIDEARDCASFATEVFKKCEAQAFLQRAKETLAEL